MPTKSRFTSREKAFVRKTVAGASNTAHRQETLEALRLFEKEDVYFLVFQLGVVNQYKNAKEGVHFSAPYENVGLRLWNNCRKQLWDAICGESDTYQEERAKLQSSTESAIIILIPLVLSALNIPPQASGVAIVISLMILKIGLKTFCSTAGDLKKLRGKPGQTCSATGRYMNLHEGTIETVRKGTKFPRGRANSEWVFLEEAVEDN